MQSSDSKGNREWEVILCPDKVAFIDCGPCADMRWMLVLFWVLVRFYTTMKMLQVLIYILRKDCMMNCPQWETLCALCWSTSFYSNLPRILDPR